MQISVTNQKNKDASSKNLEVQMGQIAKEVIEHKSRPLVTNTQTNPMEQYKAITTKEMYIGR